MLEHIPYIQRPSTTIPLNVDIPLIADELKVSVFIASATAGLLLGVRISSYYARVKQLDERLFRDQVFWGLVFAFCFAHWVELVLYKPEVFARDPSKLLSFSQGISSFGGYLGAVFGMTWYLRREGQPLLVYADANVFGALTGMSLARLGCAWVHDHPGRIVPPGTWLAVGPWPYTPGPCSTFTGEIWRWDLGLLEMLVLVCLAAFVYLAWDWRGAAPGRLSGLVALSYGAARLGLDFLREVEPGLGVKVVDHRYFGMTPAQYGSLLLMAIGLWLLVLRKHTPEDLRHGPAN